MSLAQPQAAHFYQNAPENVRFCMKEILKKNLGCYSQVCAMHTHSSPLMLATPNIAFSSAQCGTIANPSFIDTVTACFVWHCFYVLANC